MTGTELALKPIIRGIAHDIDKDADVAVGLLLIAADQFAAEHGLPREDIEQYAIDRLMSVAI